MVAIYTSVTCLTDSKWPFLGELRTAKYNPACGCVMQKSVTWGSLRKGWMKDNVVLRVTLTEQLLLMHHHLNSITSYNMYMYITSVLLLHQPPSDQVRSGILLGDGEGEREERINFESTSVDI